MDTRAPLPEHVTLPLLDVITRSSLDDDYRVVSDARATGRKEPREEERTHWRAAAVALAFGLLIVTAAVQTSREADANRATREGLIAEIQDRQQELREHQSRIADLREETDRMNQQLATLVRTERAQAARTTRLGAVAGFTPVSGEGVDILVDDDPSGVASGIVLDEHLALLVDGLWAAGAEAIAVNGRRITTLTGIRTAGTAINIGNVPIRPPYRIQVIGDSSRLQADFSDTPSGGAWWNLAHAFGYIFEMQNAARLELPAARSSDLGSAREHTAPSKENKQ